MIPLIQASEFCQNEFVLNQSNLRFYFLVFSLKMELISNDLEVFELLERAGEVTFDFSKRVVKEFSNETFWALLIFSPSGPLKGSKLFLIENESLFIEAEKKLLPELLALPEEHGYDILKNKALSIVEKLICRRRNQELFFDAH